MTSLKPYNTFGLDVKTRELVTASSIKALKSILVNANSPTLILGGGSNILFTKDFDGCVIKNEILGKEIVHETGEYIHLKMGAGENWHNMVTHCVHQNWYGLENLALIPGTVGAAPIQNIGAYGVELADRFVCLEALNRKTLEIETFTLDESEFGYRTSVFKTRLHDQYVITSVTLKLYKTPKLNTQYAALQSYLTDHEIHTPSLMNIYDAVIAIRQSKLPNPHEIGNAGSFFKNPIIPRSLFNLLNKQFPNIPSFSSGDEIKVPAAWLIEQSGFKGRRFGDAGVHEKQALVLVNYGKARGQEILDLSKKIQQAVSEKFSISLTPEVNII